MDSEEENKLKCHDAFGIMCADVRDIARELGYGELRFPSQANPGLIMQVHDGVISQVELVFDHQTKKYRAD